MNNKELEKKINSISFLLIREKGYMCHVDILIELGYLSQKDYEAWRFGKVEYLEKVVMVNLGKLSTINRIIRQVARKRALKESYTTYNKYGKGPKHILIFSKSGNYNIEKAYATHYLDAKRINELKNHQKSGTSGQNIPADENND
ncbi:MAG TPA: hypothetical protein DDW27_21215 [Bacteroidales bacterium]|nr:hypothetical protein [Bacteroidales bacterium]